MMVSQISYHFIPLIATNFREKTLQSLISNEHTHGVILYNLPPRYSLSMPNVFLAGSKHVVEYQKLCSIRSNRTLRRNDIGKMEESNMRIS